MKTTLILMAQDLITLFTHYANILDSYFKDAKNREEHSFLYEEYLNLGKDIKKVREKYKL